MKSHFYTAFIFHVIAFMGCTSNHSSDPLISEHSRLDPETTTYEGEILFDTARYLHLVIELHPTSDTEGSFTLIESVSEKGIMSNTATTDGFYSIYVSNEGQQTIHLENTALPTPLRRTFVTQRGLVREQNFRNTDLTFYMSGEHLQLLEDGDIVSDEKEYLFYKRTTPEFTLEGHLVYRGDTSFFYETNTKISWPLLKLGSYYQAAREHNTLANKKNDTTFLKATGYCISWITKTEKSINALVLKRIIQSSSL